MADDNNARYRTNDSFGRGPAPSGGSNDPLAELAKLIGQNDPFADFGGAPRSQHQAEPAQPYAGQPSQQPYAPQTYASPAYAPYVPPQYAPEPEPRYAESYSQQPESHPQHYGSEQQPNNDWPGAPSAPPSYAPSDPYALPSQQPFAPVPGFDTPIYPEPAAHAPQGFRPVPGFDPPPGFPSHDRPHYPGQPPTYPSEPEAGAMPPPHDDEFYDDAPRGGRRKGMLTVAAVLGLAVFGTASAVGYRSFFGGPGGSSPPPVIRASNEPSKVAPPQAAAPADQAGRFGFDRFADRGKDEQVVRREETPLDAKDLARAPAPRTVLPGAPVASPPNGRAPAGTTATANPPSAIGDPKRVRTVPIRPDQSDLVASAPQGAVPDALPPPPSASIARPLAPPPPSRAAEPPPSRSARVAPPSAPSPAPSANAPLSLSPDGGQPAAPPPSRSAAVVPPAPRAAAPAPVASGGGRFHVQVSSQKSESDAESSYRSIQSKYSGVLGGQPHTIRRADLGAKGVYFRAMVGPFASRDQAIQLCTSLKSAGGDCVVQAN